MDGKCTKCENTQFEIQKYQDKSFVNVICSECGTVVGVLEDIDFKKQYNKIISNHGFFERRINELENQIKHMEKDNKEMLNMVQWIADRISKKL